MTTGKQTSGRLLRYDPKGYIEVGKTASEYNFNLTPEGLHFSSKQYNSIHSMMVWIGLIWLRTGTSGGLL
jgi:hypothetical protein